MNKLLYQVRARNRSGNNAAKRKKKKDKNENVNAKPTLQHAISINADGVQVVSLRQCNKQKNKTPLIHTNTIKLHSNGWHRFALAAGLYCDKAPDDADVDVDVDWK